MKQGWEVKKLGELIIENQKSKIQVRNALNEGNYLFFTSGEGTRFYDRYFCSGENIFIATGGKAVIKFYDGKASYSTDTYSIKANNSLAITKYLFYYLLLKIDTIERKMFLGTAIKHLQKKEFKNILINLPSISEQIKIVSIIDEIFENIKRAKENTLNTINNTREIFISYLRDIFKDKLSGDEKYTLDSICELIIDCEHKTAPIQETGYPSIRTPNIGKGFLILDGVNRVSEETYVKWTKRAIPKADDLILAREAPAGNVAVIPENLKVCLGQRTVLIRPKRDKLCSKYLAYLLLSKDVQEKLLLHSRGATVAHINMKDIRAFNIYNIPPIVKQLTIIKIIDRLSIGTKELEVIYQQKLNDLEELKKSLLQKAFNGELTN